MGTCQLGVQSPTGFSCSSTLRREASEVKKCKLFIRTKRESNRDFFFFINESFFLNRLEACINAIYLPPDEIWACLKNTTDTTSTDEEKDSTLEMRQIRQDGYTPAKPNCQDSLNLQITSRLLVLIYTIIFQCVFLIFNVYFKMSCLWFIFENKTVKMCSIESFGFSTCRTQICHFYNYILMPFIIWPADILSSLHLILMDVVPTTNNSQKMCSYLNTVACMCWLSKQQRYVTSVFFLSWLLIACIIGILWCLLDLELSCLQFIFVKQTVAMCAIKIFGFSYQVVGSKHFWNTNVIFKSTQQKNVTFL